MKRFTVRRVVGRYPGDAVFHPEDIRHEVTREGDVIALRLDDSRHSEFWMQIELTEQASDNSPRRPSPVKELPFGTPP